MSTQTTYPFPTELYYERASHLWIRHDGTLATIGLDALGLEALGDLAYVSLAEVGTLVWRGQPMGTLEAAKMVGDLVAPLSGTLLTRNENVLRDPSLVNHDPYGEGWLVRIAPSDWTYESAALLHGSAVHAWFAAERQRDRQQGWSRERLAAHHG